jgi:hypothetical protein
LVCSLGFKSLLFNFYEKSEMKKSLIALAVLAASGASFAQVSVTGNLTYGYQTTTAGDIKTTPGGVVVSPSGDTAGLGAETARVIFTAKEDLGGGYAATAVLSVNTNPGVGNTGDDSTLTLVTPVGALTLGTVKSADYLSGGIAGVGAYYAGWDGSTNKIFTTRTFRDFAAFTIPVGAFTFSLSQAEAANETTFGQGMTGAAAATFGGSSAPVTTLSATYAAGPLVANGQYAVFKNSGLANGVVATPLGNLGSPNVKDTARLSASYDLGMAKLGAGLVISNHTGPLVGSAAKTTDYLVGAKLPMGASSFGLTFASRTYADIVPGTSSTGTGYSLEYGYAMSKRTSVIVNYARWTTPFAAAYTGNTVAADASTQTQVLLSHSF